MKVDIMNGKVLWFVEKEKLIMNHNFGKIIMSNLWIFVQIKTNGVWNYWEWENDS